MAISALNEFDRKLADMYAEKVTVNLESKSTMKPEDFWNSMCIIASNNKAVINYKVK